jgi:3-oxoacyl-[acyl-carrier-protein] synthase II
MPLSSSIAVTGIGLVTPAGIGVDANWRALCAGVSTAGLDDELAGLPAPLSCRVPDFDPVAFLGRSVAWRLDRVSQLASVAADEALSSAGLDPTTWDGARVGVVMGNALGGAVSYETAHRTLLEEGDSWVSPMLMVTWPVNMVAGMLAMRFDARGSNLVVSTACASGTTAIGLARNLLETGECDVVIAGGAEAPLARTPMAAFQQMGAISQRVDDPARASRPFDLDRDGFVAAEGAAVLVLERSADAAARGATARAEIRGFGSSADAHHPSAPHPDGVGVIAAISTALRQADLSAADVDHVNAHGTSTPMNDRVEAGVIRKFYSGTPVVTSSKGVVGHSLGAAGAIEAAYTVLALENGVVPPTANLDRPDPELDIDVVQGVARASRPRVAVSHSFGFGGQNGVLVLIREAGDDPTGEVA